MKRPMETYYGDTFFQDDTLMYVNRNAENFTGSYHNHDFLEIAYIAEGKVFITWRTRYSAYAKVKCSISHSEYLMYSGPLLQTGSRSS